MKWVIELNEYIIKYQPRLALKGQVMADFRVELSQKPTHLVKSPRKQWWTLHVNGASKVSGSEIGLIMQSPIGELVE